MLVLVASTGAAVSIACDAAASVGAVGDALAAHPDVAVPRRDQLLIFDGRRLEGETRTLAEYGLPERAGDFLETARATEPLAYEQTDARGSSGAPGPEAKQPPRSERGDVSGENETPPNVEYVFLYRKSALRSERASSAAETFPETLEETKKKESASAVAIEPTPPPPRSDGSHPLERAAVRFFLQKSVLQKSVSSRLHRLVALERSLAHAGARVQARRAASAARLRLAEALVRATRVRALAADAASASAETHLAAALAAHAEFTRRMRERTRRQADLLASFEDDLETLRATTLETNLSSRTDSRTDSTRSMDSVPPCSPCSFSLLDLVDSTRLREWRDTSRDAHDGFVARMESLETRVAELKRGVERVFATTPDVDVEALEAELDSARDALRAQKDVVDEVLADAANARTLASRCVAALDERNLLGDANDAPFVDADGGPSKRDLLGETNTAARKSFSSEVSSEELVTAAEVDALSAAEAAHASASFARVAATDDVLAAFHAHCEVCGSAMAANARARLIEIAETQRAIGAARDARAALEEIATRTEKPFARLFGACRALPARHAACLAESARRAAYAERLAARARRVADLFAADEKKERDRREAFRRDAASANADERLRFLAPALDAVARATLGSATPAPSVEITARGVPRERDVPDDARLGSASRVDEELAAVFASTSLS